MSYSSHRRDASDAAKPLAHRASDLRSCALHVADKLRVSRSEVFTRIKAEAGIDLGAPASGDDVSVALAILERMRMPPEQGGE